MKKRGRGIACMWYPIGFTVAANPSAAVVKINEDGTATLLTGTVETGQVGELGVVYQLNGLNGPVNFFGNPNGLGMNALTNDSNARYNALKGDVNHRFSHGLQLQANYVYSKVMSDAAGDAQGNLDPAKVEFLVRMGGPNYASTAVHWALERPGKP